MPNQEVSAVQTDYGECRPTDLDAFDPKHLESALQKVRAEAEEERRLDPDLDTIPESAFDDVERFFEGCQQIRWRHIWSHRALP